MLFRASLIAVAILFAGTANAAVGEWTVAHSKDRFEEHYRFDADFGTGSPGAALAAHCQDVKGFSLNVFFGGTRNPPVYRAIFQIDNNAPIDLPAASDIGGMIVDIPHADSVEREILGARNIGVRLKTRDEGDLDFNFIGKPAPASTAALILKVCTPLLDQLIKPTQP